MKWLELECRVQLDGLIESYKHKMVIKFTVVPRKNHCHKATGQEMLCFVSYFCLMQQNATFPPSVSGVHCEAQLVSMLLVTHFDERSKLKWSVAWSWGNPHLESLSVLWRNRRSAWNDKNQHWCAKYFRTGSVCWVCVCFLPFSYVAVAVSSLPCGCWPHSCYSLITDSHTYSKQHANCKWLMHWSQKADFWQKMRIKAKQSQTLKLKLLTLTFKCDSIVHHTFNNTISKMCEKHV